MEKVLPEAINADGRAFSINADFRNVLRALKMLADDSIFEPQKPVLLARWFFPQGAPENVQACFDTFLTAFVQENAGPGASAPDRAPRFDFEFDAEEIYTSFLSQYGIDLLRIPFLHWYEFAVLLGGLNEDTAFRRKIAIRFLDLKDLKGDTLLKAKKAQAAVQIPTKQSREEARRMQDIEAALMGDGDLSSIF